MGGALPFLILLFAGLSATGALAVGAAGVLLEVTDTRSAWEQLKKNKRHNTTMKAIALGKGTGYIIKLIRHVWNFIWKPTMVEDWKKKNIEINLPDRPLTKDPVQNQWKMTPRKNVWNFVMS